MPQKSPMLFFLFLTGLFLPIYRALQHAYLPVDQMQLNHDEKKYHSMSDIPEPFYMHCHNIHLLCYRFAYLKAQAVKKYDIKDIVPYHDIKGTERLTDNGI